MDRLWAHEGWVRCVHPGWDILVGWEAIRASWQQIFANTRWLRVTPTAVEAAIIGDKPIPRTEVVKKVWAYIKKNQLQDKRIINADDKLKQLFGGKARVDMFEMMKHVNKNLS